MLIGWATPFNVQSAIGRFSRAVTEDLHRRGHQPVIIRTETGSELDLEPLQTELQVTCADSVDVRELDVLVVNFGNHAPYHSQCVRLLAERAPLGIFHDAEMRDFEWGMQHRHGIGIGQLERMSASELAGSANELISIEARSLLASIAAMCFAAVVHGPHYREIVGNFCSGPVEIIPLCYPDPGNSRMATPPGEGRRVIIFGVISEHKQPRRVMHALSLLEKREGPFELHLAGAIEDSYRDRLLEEARTLALKPPIIHGFVTDDRLQQLIEDSHLVCCLRYPVTEGGSASLATALYRQRPVIVADVASYSMVPDNLVFKVSYGHDANDLASAISAVFANHREAEARARRARVWAEERFSPLAYASLLSPLLERHRIESTVVDVARSLVPAITDPSGHVMRQVVHDFADVLDWMRASQGPASG